ncbi:MAG: alpha/beta hydrolase [Anaerolineales bacterium]|nr:alpha/beta hydrolase [Anaerolineales bacterium]
MKRSIFIVMLSFIVLSSACKTSAKVTPSPIPPVAPSAVTQTLAVPTLFPTTIPTPLSLLWTSSAYTEPSPLPTFTRDKIGSVERNVTYCIAGNVELKMDIYYPRLPAAQKYPLIIYIHGGQFIKGDKQQVSGQEPSLDGKFFVTHGYALASLNYRLGPEYRLPTMYEDVKCAVRHLRANAASYNIDPERIGAIGTSSGATLAVIIGLTDPAAGFEGIGAYEGISSRVQAVVAQFPQVTFDTPPYSNAEQASRDQSLPSDPSPELLSLLNLYTYVSADDPPFMIFHGDADPALDPKLSEKLNAELVTVGVTSSFTLVHNGGHGWQPKDARKAGVPYGPIPNATEILDQQLEFFDKYLK